MVCTRTSIYGLVVAGLMITASAAHADEYADVDRLFGAGQFTEAVQKADQVLASNPRDARMRFLKGLVLSEQGRPAEATAVFVKLTEDFPDLPEPYNNLAVLYSKQGQYDQARRSLEAAIRTNPSYATAYENLGDVYAKLASQAYSKALQIDGGNAKVSPKLAMIRDLFSPKATALAATSAKPIPAAPPAAKPAAPVVVAAAPKPAPPAAAPAAVPASPAASKPATPAAAAATAAPATTAPASGEAQEVQAAVMAWASAWSRKDMNAYFAAYTAEFSGGKSRKAWEDERRARITGKRSITVVLSDFETKLQGDKALIQFRQSYSADALKVTSRKTLEMNHVSGRWLIQKESTGS